MRSPEASVRAGVVAGVGFLSLDAVLLVLGGVWTHRLSLVFWGCFFGGLAVLPIVLWRRYRGRLEEVRSARRAVAQELRHWEATRRQPPP
jgi:membrane protein implicated in regulation of membrane protease activity